MNAIDRASAPRDTAVEPAGAETLSPSERAALALKMKAAIADRRAGGSPSPAEGLPGSTLPTPPTARAARAPLDAGTPPPLGDDCSVTETAAIAPMQIAPSGRPSDPQVSPASGSIPHPASTRARAPRESFDLDPNVPASGARPPFGTEPWAGDVPPAGPSLPPPPEQLLQAAALGPKFTDAAFAGAEPGPRSAGEVGSGAFLIAAGSPADQPGARAPGMPAVTLPSTANRELSTAATAREEKDAAPTDDGATGRPDDPLGVTMLQTLFSQSSLAPTAATSAAPAPAAPARSLETVVAEVVSRILVSDPLHDGRREVRIELSHDVLPDTQVRLWRDGGRLHVEFSAPPAVADTGLRDALPRLGDAIQQRTAETQTPAITLRLSTADAGGQPRDGRSRQQYVPFGPEDAPA